MMQVPGYPEYFEEWWIEFAQSVFHCSSLYEGEARIRARIQTLTDLFTLRRNAISLAQYSDPELAAAYGLFYFPETFVRMQFPLVELLHRGWQPNKDFCALDLGSGSGSAGFSAAVVLKGLTRKFHLTAIDGSHRALQISDDLAKDVACYLRNLHRQTAASDVSLVSNIGSGPWDLILLSFSLNELARDWSDQAMSAYLRELIERLTPEGMLVILEPALRETAERLEILRDDLLAAAGAYVWAPCLHRNSCPLLETKKFWCHEVRRWNPPSTLQFFNRHLHRTENVLKFSFLAIGRQPPMAVPSDSFRLLSSWKKATGKWIATGCAADGEKHEYEILKRNARQPDSQNVVKAERGDIILPIENIRID